MATKDDDKMHAPAMKTNEAAKPAPEPKLPAPTKEELDKAFEDLVVKAEAAGQRDDPVVSNARALLDRKSGT